MARWCVRSGSLGSVLVFVLLFCVALPAVATYPGDNGSIMYARWGPEYRNYGFFTIEPDGTAVTPVGISGMEDADWSPDGATLAYAAYVGSGPKVLLYDRETGKRTPVVQAADFPTEVEYIADVAFGPSGDRLAIGVHASEADTFHQLYTVGIDGSDLTLISGEWELFSPDWSSTDRIVAAVETSRRTKLVTLDPDGSDVELLVRLAPSRHRTVSLGSSPTWAPDGSAVAFTSQSDRGRGDIWIVDSDGSDLRRVTDTRRRWEYGAVWSPDGASLAVSRGGRSISHTTDLWIVGLAGGRTRLTDSPRLEEFVQTWRPA